MTDREMHQVQHAQTAGCTGSAKHVGNDGKRETTVRLQDELTGALIGLARAIDDPALASAETWTIMTEGLLATAPDACISDATLVHDAYPDDATIEALIRKVRAEKERLAPGCSSCTAPCGRTADYDMQVLWSAEEAVRALKLRILADLREIAAHIAHAPADQTEETDVYPLLYEALFKIGYDESVEALLPTVRKVEETKLSYRPIADLYFTSV